MKKVLLLVAALFFVFTLSACETKHEVECVANDGSGTETFIYNSEELLEYHVDGEEANQEMVDLLNASFKLLFTGDDFIEMMDDMVANDDMFETTCTKK